MHMTTVSQGTIHTLSSDLKKALLHDSAALEAWESLTPLARNEWICWVDSPKRKETRDEHLVRTIKELNEGVRRPCCWIGCIHRTDKEVSPSVRAILNSKKR